MDKHTLFVLLACAVATHSSAGDQALDWTRCFSSIGCSIFRAHNITDNVNETLQVGICVSSLCNISNISLTCQISCENTGKIDCTLPEACPVISNTSCVDSCTNIPTLTIETTPDTTTQAPDPITTIAMAAAEVTTVHHLTTPSPSKTTEGTTEGNRVHPDDIYVVIIFVSVLFLIFIIVIVYYFVKRARCCCFKQSTQARTNSFQHARLGGSTDTLNSNHGANDRNKIRATKPAMRDEPTVRPTSTARIETVELAPVVKEKPEPHDYKEMSVAQLVASHPVHRGDDATKSDDVTKGNRSRAGTVQEVKQVGTKFVIVDEEEEKGIPDDAGPRTPVKSQYSTVLDAVTCRRKGSQHNYQEVFKYPSTYSSLQSIREAQVKRTSNYDSLILAKTFVNPYSPAGKAIQPFQYQPDIGGVRSMSQGQSPRRGHKHMDKDNRISRTLDRNPVPFYVPGNNFAMRKIGRDDVFNENDENDVVTLRPRSADSVLGKYPRRIVESPSFNKDDESDYEEL